MRKRGRPSAAELSTVVVAPGAQIRPEPPAGLSRKEAAHWRAIVASLRADWFTRCETWPLLADYVRYAELSTKLSREMRGVAVSDPRFERLFKRKLAVTNSIIRLATKLRITVQATRSSRTNSHAVVPPIGPPVSTFKGWQ